MVMTMIISNNNWKINNNDYYYNNEVRRVIINEKKKTRKMKSRARREAGANNLSFALARSRILLSGIIENQVQTTKYNSR